MEIDGRSSAVKFPESETGLAFGLGVCNLNVVNVNHINIFIFNLKFFRVIEMTCSWLPSWIEYGMLVAKFKVFKG